MGKIYTNPFDWGYADDNALNYVDTSEDGIKSMINQALDDALDDVKDEIVDETMSSMDIKLEGENLLYKLMVNGSENGEINIPKDQFLKSTSYDKDNKKLIFVMQTADGETTTEVSISDLVASIEEKNREQDVVLAEKADKSELEPLAVKSEVENALGAFARKEEVAAAVAPLAVKAEVTEEINSAVDGLNAALADKADASALETLATKAEVEAVDAKVEALEIPDVSGLATKEEVQSVDNKVEALEIPSIEGLAKSADVTAEIAAAVEPLATKEELANKVDWVESTPDRKHIVLKNHDSVLGTATDGTTYNVAMVSKWDVADFGSAQLHLNLNTKDGVATINDNKNIATEDYVSAAIDGLAKSADVTNEIAAAVAPLATKSEIADKANVSQIPTRTSELVNDSNFITSHQSLEEYAKRTFVSEEIAKVVGGAPETLDTLKEIADALQDNATMAMVSEAISTKANAEDVYNKTEVYNKQESEAKFQASGDYVPVEQYNDLKARLDNLEIMMSVYNAEREAQMDEIISNMSSDNKEVVTDTLMESIVVPETTVAYTITAPLTDNSTVELTSPKYMTLINTSKEPVSTTISHEYAEGETTSATTVYLVGDFNTLTLENISPSVKSGYDAASVKNVVISENNVKNLSLSLDFQDDATITNNSDKDITIYDKSNSEVALSIVAPNSTVTLNNGQFTTLNAEVSDNTLIIKKNVHIDNLNLAKGNAIVEVARAEEVAGIVENYTVADGYSVSHRVYHITNENSSKLGGVGEMILDEDITRTSSIVAPLAPAYDAVWNLNGHNITVEGTPKSGVYLNRYASNLEVKGEGVIHCEGSYGLWNAATTGKIIINDGVTIEAQTHAVYAEKGVIEINGGTFKLTNWETADKDENGNLRFLINCLDANYRNGSANIIVKGGKFYDFDPSNCAAEGIGTSFVAEGYGSVMTTEMIDGVEHKVYEVKPING